jgi:GntR family transcriptional regulator, transcriptional repressor for pyruvate dehydrogenase complex
MPATRSSWARPVAGGDTSVQIALEIRRYLARADLRPGDRLGTEQELAAEFGVSRPTLREALRLLSSSHLIRASRGPRGGIFVASTPNEGMGRNLSESISTMLETQSVSLGELVEARIQLEVPLAGLAAKHATAETILKLDAAITEQEGKHAASEAFRLADACFHRTIAATAGNELLQAFASWTLDVLQPSLIASIGDAIDADTIIRQHREILRAVRRGQPAGASRAMSRHLEYLRELVRRFEDCPDNRHGRGYHRPASNSSDE